MTTHSQEGNTQLATGYIVYALYMSLVHLLLVKQFCWICLDYQLIGVSFVLYYYSFVIWWPTFWLHLIFKHYRPKLAMACLRLRIDLRKHNSKRSRVKSRKEVVS